MASVPGEWRKNTEHRLQDIDGGKPNSSEKNPSHCHAIYHKSHVHWPGIELGAHVARIKRKTSSAAPALFYIEEGGSRILRNVSYYSLFVGWDEADRVAEWIVVGTIPV